MPKVSVIVLVYGDKQWLEQCISSIRTKASMELIVESDPEGTGAAAARNRGLRKARGDYVMFVDSDDYLEPGAIDLMLSEMNGCDLVCGSFRKFGDFEQLVSHPTKTLKMSEVAQYVMSNLRDPRNHQMLSGCWAKLFKRELVVDFPKLITAEDMGFNFDYLRRCHSVRFLENVVYHNRKRKGSLSTSFDIAKKDRLFGLMDGLRYVKDFLDPMLDDPDGIEDALDSSKVYHAMLYAERLGPGALRKLFP